MAALPTETPQINERQFNKVRSKVWGKHKNVSVILCSIYLLLAYLFSSKNCNFLVLVVLLLERVDVTQLQFQFLRFCIFEFLLWFIVFVQTLPRPTSFNHFVNNALWVGFYKTDNISEDIKVAHAFY